MIAYILIGFLWLALGLMSCQIIYLNRFVIETQKNLRTLNRFVLKNPGGNGNGRHE